MEDAGMKNGALPLRAVLFEIDAIDQEVELMAKSPETQRETLEALFEIISDISV